MFVISELWVRLLGTFLFLAGLVFFASPMLVGIRHAGCFAGTVFCVLGIIFFAANPLIAPGLQKLWQINFWHFVLCLVMGGLGVSVILAMIISIFMIHAAYNKPKTENTVVILGCKVRNGVPSLMLKKRLDAACIYLEKHPDVPVIVCGGQGADESISEAQCMFEYLTSHGIASGRIYQDDTSTSTLENLENAKKIITEQDWLPEITIVTDGYHQLRAANIAHDIGLKASAVSARTSWYLVPSYWVREWMGICYQFVFG